MYVALGTCIGQLLYSNYIGVQQYTSQLYPIPNHNKSELKVQMAQYITLLLIFSNFGISLGLRQIKHEGGTLAIESIRDVLSNRQSTFHKRFGNNLQERVLWEAYRMASAGGSSVYNTYVPLDQLEDSFSADDPSMTAEGMSTDYNTYVNMGQLQDSLSDEDAPLGSIQFDRLLNTFSDEEDVIMGSEHFLGLVDYNINYENNQDYNEKHENSLYRDALSGEHQVTQYVNEAHQLEPYNNI